MLLTALPHIMLNTMFHSQEVNFTPKTKFSKIKDEYLNIIGYKKSKRSRDSLGNRRKNVLGLRTNSRNYLSAVDCHCVAAAVAAGCS